jgi:hypothetical protein
MPTIGFDTLGKPAVKGLEVAYVQGVATGTVLPLGKLGAA